MADGVGEVDDFEALWESAAAKAEEAQGEKPQGEGQGADDSPVSDGSGVDTAQQDPPGEGEEGDDGEPGSGEDDSEDQEGDGEDGGDEGEQPAELSEEDRQEKLQQVESLAKELGLVYQNGTVEGKEFAALRAERRKNEQRVQKQLQQVQQQWADRLKQLEPDIQKARQAQEALETGDYDAFAKAWGFDDYGTLSEKAVEAQLDPNTKTAAEIRRLRREMREQQEAQKRAEQQARQTQEQQRIQQQAQEYHSYVAEEIQQLAHVPDVLKGDQAFVQQVVEEQRKFYDPATNKTIPSWQAARNVLDTLRHTHDNLAQVFSHQGRNPEKPSGGASTNAKKQSRKRPPKSVSQGEARAASSSGGELSEQEFFEKWAQKMRAAANGG